MSKICPECHKVNDGDNRIFCQYCGSKLVDNIGLNPMLNLGDANAISGGVNINQSKNITSHDTHYHTTTVQERAKSDSELKLEATNQLRAKAEEIMNGRGRIDSAAVTQLRQLALQLGIGNEDFKEIITEVRSSRTSRISGLSTANARYLQQAQQAVQTNDMDTLYVLMPRMEALAAISQDDNVQYLYYLLLAINRPSKCMELYEQQTDENYWRTFWTIVSYIKEGRHIVATRMLAMFDPLRYEKSEEDQNLLEAYFNLIKGDMDEAQGFLDTILGDVTLQVKPMLRAIESKMYGEMAESSEVRFYTEWLISKSDGSPLETLSEPKRIAEEKKSQTDTKTKTISEKSAISGSSSSVTKFDSSILQSYIDDYGYLRKLDTSEISKLKSALLSAPKDNYQALFCLGQLYIQEKTSAANLKLAYTAIKTASEHGVYEAGAYLAYFYLYGKVVLQDLEEAERRIKIDDDFNKNPIFVQMLVDLYNIKGNAMLADVWKSKLNKLK